MSLREAPVSLQGASAKPTPGGCPSKQVPALPELPGQAVGCFSPSKVHAAQFWACKWSPWGLLLQMLVQVYVCYGGGGLGI